MRKFAITAFVLLVTAALAGGALQVAGIVDLTGILSGSDDGQDAKGAAESGARPVPVEIGRAESLTAEEVFRTAAEVVAEDRVVLTAEVAENIAEILVDDGARVEAGQPIVRFDAAEEQATLMAARSRLAETEADLKRARELKRNEFSPEARVESAFAATESAAAEVARAERAVEDQTISAPFTGRVGFLQVSPGAYTEPGTAIASIVTDRSRVRMSLPQRIAERVGDGTPVRLYPPGREEPLRTELVILSPIADTATRSVPAEALVPVGANNPLPGTFITAEIVTASREDAVFVPEVAVVSEGDKAFVYRLDESDTAHWVEVVTRTRRDGLIEVEGRIGAGDRVVTQGLQKIRDGARIAPRRDGTGAQ